MAPAKPDPKLQEDYWRKCIEDAPLNDQSWSVQVVMMEVAGSDQDRNYLNKFEEFAAQEKRFVLKNICKSETMFMINQLGGEKKVKDENLRVFEEGQAYLKDKKDIPPDIQALIIKHLILKMKEEYLYIQRQQLFVRDGMRRESATMVDRAEVRGTVFVPPPEPAEPPPQPQGKGKKGEEGPVKTVDEPEEGKKYNTLLRVRGEEWRDKVYVDDFPIDGPNLYVAVTGFMEPLLAGCLIKIGVPLIAIFQIRIDISSHNIPSTLARPTKRGQSQTEILIGKSLSFWQDLQELRINKDTSEDYTNTAFVVFSPPYWSADDLSGDADKIYDELCFLMYDIQDLTRQRHNYLDNMHIIHIPTEAKNITYEHSYHQHSDALLLECCSTYSILDSILQTVCNKQEFSKDTSRTSLSAAMTMNQTIQNEESKVEKAETLINDVFNALNATDSNKKSYRLTYGDESENHKDPIVINFGDFAKRQTFHLSNIHLDDIVYSMLLGMPINKLWLKQERPQAELEAKLNFHVNVLLSCFNRPDVETTELIRLLHILACRKLYNNRSSLKKSHLSSITISEFKKNYLRRSVLAEPLPKGVPIVLSSISSKERSFPSMTKIENMSVLSNDGDSEDHKLRFLFDCPDISELVSASEITSDKLNDHIIDDFELFEDYTQTRAFQVLREAFTNFNCLDYKYCEVTDTINLMFFNSHDHDGIAREEWRSHLPTPVCLQDFFDFVLEEHYDWIQNEEKIYEQKLTQDSQSQCAAVDPLALQSCVENQDVEMELLIEGSLKFQETVQTGTSGEHTTDTSLSMRDKHSTATITPSTVVNSKGSKKTKTTALTSPTTSFNSSKTDTIISSKPFQGYDLGERRVEVFGKDATFYSKDGTRVSSRYTFIIPMNLENIILNVVPGNGPNAFWIHRTLGDSVTPEIKNACESFRITSKDQVIINIKKEVYRIPIRLATVSMNDQDQLKIKEPKIPSEEELPIIFESKTYHSFCVTCPNGLITESVHEDNSSTLSHIKQYYVVPAPHLDEEMRCITLNGEVIIFRKSGDIEVLRNDGTYIKITKYKKRVVEPKTDIISTDINIDQDKLKKVQAENEKIKKEKPAKLSAKTSKNTALAPEKVPSSIKEEYELSIDEFEIIETSGLQQQWIGECSYDIEKLLIRTATDYCLGEVFSRRMDGTQTLWNKDGVQIVTFPNLTRIITKFIIEDEEIYPEWTEEELLYFDLLGSDMSSKSKHSISQKSNFSSISRAQSHQSTIYKKLEEEETKLKIRTDGYISVQTCFTIEHENFTSVTVSKADGKVSVDSPNNTSVSLNTDGQYEINLDSATVATFDGEDLRINYEACPECQSKTTCKIKICQDDAMSVTKSQQCLLRLEDSFGQKIVVNEEGAINMLDGLNNRLNMSLDTTVQSPPPAARSEETELTEENRAHSKSNSSVVHGKCRQMYSAKEMRFFIFRRDLTCSELVHRVLLEQDIKAARYQPWFSINEYDAFGDNRSLLSLLMPVSLTESEKWIMNSQFSGKPKSLKYKDLKKDSGKGFYHWMRPYRRFKAKPETDELTPRLPRAFILRILEKQWKDKDRNLLRGARELLRAVLQYRRVMESDSETLLHMPLIDQRSETDRKVDDVIQALGHRVYEDLKARLSIEVVGRAKPDITTKPRPHSSEELNVEEEVMAEGEKDPAKVLEAERESLIQEAQVDEMSPNLRRYWNRRRELYKEEQFYLYLLREGSVPPYFRNVLGGAIWWEMNNAADVALDAAERRKMKCVCAKKVSNQDNIEPYM